MPFFPIVVCLMCASDRPPQTLAVSRPWMKTHWPNWGLPSMWAVAVEFSGYLSRPQSSGSAPFSEWDKGLGLRGMAGLPCGSHTCASRDRGPWGNSLSVPPLTVLCHATESWVQTKRCQTGDKDNDKLVSALTSWVPRHCLTMETIWLRKTKLKLFARIRPVLEFELMIHPWVIN